GANASCLAPWIVARTVAGAHPAVSRYTTVKTMEVVGVPIRGGACGAARGTACEEPVQPAARACGAGTSHGAVAGPSSPAARSSANLATVVRAALPLTATAADRPSKCSRRSPDRTGELDVASFGRNGHRRMGLSARRAFAAWRQR